MYDGEYGESFSIGKYCNDNEPPEIWSTSNILLIFFVSDFYYTGEGFNASYKFYNGKSRPYEPDFVTEHHRRYNVAPCEIKVNQVANVAARKD